MNCKLYKLAIEAGMDEEEIKRDVTLLMAGVAEIDLQVALLDNPMAEINPVLSCSYRVYTENDKSKVNFFNITVDRVLK